MSKYFTSSKIKSPNIQYVFLFVKSVVKSLMDIILHKNNLGKELIKLEKEIQRYINFQSLNESFYFQLEIE